MNKKTRKQTLRSRIRDDAKQQLDSLIAEAINVLNTISLPVGITCIDLARMVGSSQTDSLQKTLISKLSDKKEAELMKIFDAQKAEESDQ